MIELILILLSDYFRELMEFPVQRYPNFLNHYQFFHAYSYLGHSLDINMLASCFFFFFVFVKESENISFIRSAWNTLVMFACLGVK